MRLRKGSIALILLGLIVIVEVVLLLPKLNILGGKEDESVQPLNPAFGFGDFATDRTRWGQRMDAVGQVLAYAEFKAEFAEVSYGKQHAASHIFGELLYDKLGIDGVSVCDSAFAFGCYHAFFGKAVAVEGIEVLPRFHRACIEKFGDLSLPCRHGIGHGIITFIGEDNILDALELCATLSDEPLGGCTSGVFMEYNFRTMSDPTGQAALTRPLKESDPYEPCRSLPEEFRQSCFFEMPQWWGSIYAGDYEKVGQLCSQVEGNARSACFMGAGNYIAPFTDHDVEKTIFQCNKMPSAEASALCIEAASWIFLGLEGRKEDAYRLCGSLEGKAVNDCREKLDANPASKN